MRWLCRHDMIIVLISMENSKVIKSFELTINLSSCPPMSNFFYAEKFNLNYI